KRSRNSSDDTASAMNAAIPAPTAATIPINTPLISPIAISKSVTIIPNAAAADENAMNPVTTIATTPTIAASAAATPNTIGTAIINAETTCFVLSSSLSNFSPSTTNASSNGSNALTIALNMSSNGSPKDNAKNFILLNAIFNTLTKSSYLCSASFVSATFSSHALLPTLSASLTKSTPFAARLSTSIVRSFPSPKSSNIVTVSSPSAFRLFKPSINDTIASAGASSNDLANSSADIPAILANPSKSSPPWTTAVFIPFITFWNAVPPASARIPKDESEPANDNISASVSPIVVPAPARRIPILTISFSVVARLLPRSTIVEPRRSTSPMDMPVMLANCASDVAASSAVIFVATPISAMVLVKSRMCFFSIPSCPATCAIPAISSAAIGISVDILRIPSESSLNSASVPLITLRTPVKADSNVAACDISAPTPAVPAAAITPKACAAPKLTPAITLPILLAVLATPFIFRSYCDTSAFTLTNISPTATYLLTFFLVKFR